MAVFHVSPVGFPPRSRRTTLVSGVAVLALASLTSTYSLLHLFKNAIFASEPLNCTREVNCSLDVPGLFLLQTGITLSGGKPGIGEHASSSRDVISKEASKAKSIDLAAQHQDYWWPWGGNEASTPNPQNSVHDARGLIGVKENKEGDLVSFLTGLGLNSLAMFGIGVVFWILRIRYPRIYANNAMDGTAPRDMPVDLPLGWAYASFRTTTDEAVNCAGLDQALLIEFCDVAMNILFRVALPTTLVLCPMHFFFGGNVAAELGDNLSRVGMLNVLREHPWILYVHAFFVWFVVLTTQGIVHRAMQKFLVRRSQWLKELPYPQASTVLIEGIPEAYRSDKELRYFFEQVFEPSAIKAACVVKETGELMAIYRESQALGEELQKAEIEWASANRAPEFRPQTRRGLMAERTDAIEFYTQQIKEREELIKHKRALVIEAAQEKVGGVNTRNGFVTFARRREAELAINLQYSNVCVEWQVSYAPEPEGVDWEDLRKNVGPRLSALLTFIGYALVSALYLVFLPVCVATTNLAYTVHLGPLQNLWMAIAPSLSLTVFTSFLPTVMINVFDRFFVLKSKTWCQLKLQEWYFWFQVFFVILVTAIGTNLYKFVESVAKNPPSLAIILADQMPKSSHFYMDYLVLQCTLQVWGLIRSAQLGKFLAAKAIFDEEEARHIAEPEDQDYYGIGSRSVRLTIVLLIGITFSTLSPLVAVLSLVFFCVSRLVYGYLIVFAETRKPDLGGAFFVLQLQHLQVGLGIYCLLMTGVLSAKAAPNMIPPAIAAPSFFYSLLSAKRFKEEYLWEKLPFKEIAFNAHNLSTQETLQVYVQPELQEAAAVLKRRTPSIHSPSQG